MREFNRISPIEKVEKRINGLKQSRDQMRRAKPSRRQNVIQQLVIVESYIKELEQELTRLKNS